MFDDFIKGLIERVHQASKDVLYHHLEYGCDTTITDEDMLKLQIDWALEKGDKKKFVELSNHLKEMRS